jgi:hypothetical protein
MTQYDVGIRQAEELIWRSPDLVGYWLDRARKGRRRWKTRLLLTGKRRFLNGFIACLEAYQKDRGHHEAENTLSQGNQGPTSTDEMDFQGTSQSGRSGPEEFSHAVR